MHWLLFIEYLVTNKCINVKHKVIYTILIINCYFVYMYFWISHVFRTDSYITYFIILITWIFFPQYFKEYFKYVMWVTNVFSSCYLFVQSCVPLYKWSYESERIYIYIYTARIRQFLLDKVECEERCHRRKSQKQHLKAKYPPIGYMT